MDIKAATARISYHLQAKPGGGFVATPSDPAMETIEGSTKGEVEQKIQVKISEIIGAQLPAPLKLGGINMTVNTKVNFTTRAQSGVSLSSSPQPGTAQNNDTTGGSGAIVPCDNSGARLRVIAVLIGVLAALIYFFLRR